MDTMSLTEARARLPELLTRVADGEVVHITRHGRPVATLVGHDRWMRTARLDVLEEARALRRRLNEFRESRTPFSDLPPISKEMADEILEYIRISRARDPGEDAERAAREWERTHSRDRDT